MESIISTEILVGSLLAIIFLYFLQILLLIISVPKIKTNNAGTKNLKFQEYNDVWNKYVLRKLN